VRYSLPLDNQPYARSLATAVTGADVVLEFSDMTKRWASLLLEHGHVMSRQQRQVLHDIKRGRGAVERSAIARMLELVPFSALTAGTWGAEQLRGMVIGRMDVVLPPVADAYESEEEANTRANVRQQRFREMRSRSAGEDVCEAFDGQVLASRIAADATHRAVYGGRSIVMASR
jgi:hypothetical protein